MPHNFVVFGLSPWNISIGCNMKDISLELSKFHKVLYIDVPLKRKERWFMQKKPLVKLALERIRAKKLLTRLNENLWNYVPEEILESVNQFDNAFLFDTFNRINNVRFSRSVRKAVRAVGFDEYVLINDNDVYNGLRLKSLLKPACTVYYLRDMLSAFHYWSRQVKRLEPTLIASYDLIVTNSEYLRDYAKTFNANSFYVGQGCDVDQYASRPDQHEIDTVLAGIPSPIIGYVGALNSERLSIPLMTELAQKMPDHNFVLIGGEDAVFRASQLHTLRNVHFLGKKNVADLPKFIFGFDVCINPQALNEITIGNYPRKVDEYLAAGKPVVATETNAMNPFRNYTYLGKDAVTYAELIKKAIRENSVEKENARRAFALEHTWTNSTKAILEALEKVYPRKATRSGGS